MIPFFRKIRKKMADDNRPLKYMRYAIGEIVLVVIGILIALTINNWNSERNEISKYKKQLLKVVESIKSDSIQLEQLKQFRLMAIDKTSQMMQELQNRNIMDSDAFINSFLSLIGEVKFVSDTDNQLKSQFENYQNIHIHEILDDYQKLARKIKFREFRHNEFSENMEIDLWKKGFFKAINPKFIKQPGNNPSYISFKKLDLNKIGVYDDDTLFALCLRTELGFSWLISEYDLLTAKGEEVTKVINPEDILRVREVVRSIYVDEKVKDYIVNIIFF
jgi:hypothetical protein